MNWIKKPRVRGRGRGREAVTVEVPAGVKKGMLLVAGAIVLGSAVHSMVAPAPAVVPAPAPAAVVEAVPALPAPFEWAGRPVECGRDVDCHNLVKPPKGKASKAPSVTRTVTVAMGTDGRTITESVTSRTKDGSVTTTVRRGPKGATVTRRVTSTR
jgi:hypothetical protein